MSNIFNLWLLNIESDKHPRSWICINGKELKETISKIEKEVIKKCSLNREQLSKIIAKNLNINHVSIKNLLRKGKFYPIPFILELCKLSQTENFYKKEILKETEFLKVNSASSKPIKAVKGISKNLAKIIGSFCADGSLSIQFVVSSKKEEELEQIKNLGKIRRSPSRREFYIAISLNRGNYYKLSNFSEENSNFQTQAHYTIKLTDEYKSNVEAFNKWIFSEFEIKPNVFYQKEVAWRTIFSNKIFARYLLTFFGFLPGYKTDTVAEPEIIKKSPLKIRKEFAKGSIMFDGCVTKQKKIIFSTISPNLANSIKDIWKKDSIKFYEYLDKRGSYNLTTIKDNPQEKLLEYFEPNTQKWKLLRWLSGDLTQELEQNKEVKDRSLDAIFEEIQNIKSCDASFLMKRFRLSHTTIRDHLKILSSQKKIRLSNRPTRINKINDSTFILLKKEFHNYIFKNLEEKFASYENLSKFSGIHKATISIWKLRKGRIPLRNIKEFCKILQINPKGIYQNIENTDREIVEVI